MSDDTNRPENGASADAQPAAEAPAEDPTAGLRAERDKLHDQLLRTAAELENTRKRTRKEVDDARSKGREDAIRELLPVFDNLERAGQAATKEADAKAIAEGVQMVLRLFEDHLQRLGVERLKSLGERFDPNLHDALQQVDSEEAPGTIVHEIQPGYRMGARLVRAATVIVARPRASTPDGSEPKPS